MNSMKLPILLACAGLWLLPGCVKKYADVVITGDQSGIDKYAINWPAAADSSSGSLLLNFWNPAGKYFNNTSNGDTKFGYWPQAHALDVVIDAYTRTNDNKYRALMDDWMVGVKQQNGNTFLNEFYDDMEWNGLAMLRAYAATNDSKFKTGADQVWADIKSGWNGNMGAVLPGVKGCLPIRIHLPMGLLVYWRPVCTSSSRNPGILHLRIRSITG